MVLNKQEIVDKYTVALLKIKKAFYDEKIL